MPALLSDVLPDLLPGRWRPPAAFDAAGYRAAHADLAGLGDLRALWHFLRHGRAEGRLPCALRAAGAEAALWRGDPAAPAALQALAAEAGPEGLWARLALARADLASGDAQAAAARLAGQGRALARTFGLPGPLFLLAEIALHLGDAGGAAAALAQARGCGGAGPGAALLQGAAALASGDVPGWRAALAPLFAPAALAVPDLAVPDLPFSDLAFPDLAGAAAAPFDRLAAAPGPLCAEGPQISVILPARNAAATIGTALSSLSAQSWRPLEVLVVDDGSSDGTAARVEAWAARDGRIRLLRAGQRLGAYGARNLGLSAARGDFIALQDADDWSHPDRLARQVQALRAAPGAPACLSHWARLDAALVPACWRPDVAVVHPNLSSLMIRRAAVQRLGVWDRVLAGADSEYLERLARVFGPGALLPVLPGVPLAFGRQRAGSLSRAGGTGLLGSGAAARADYLAAARAWHAASPAPRLQPDGPRAFPAPAALRLPEGEEVP